MNFKLMEDKNFNKSPLYDPTHPLPLVVPLYWEGIDLSLLAPLSRLIYWGWKLSFQSKVRIGRTNDELG